MKKDIDWDDFERRLIHVLFSLQHIQTFIKNGENKVAYGVAEKQIKTVEDLLRNFETDNS